MKTTTVLTQIAFTAAIIFSNLTPSLAANHQTHDNIAFKNDKIESLTSKISSPKTDSYLMVMQKQVERGDISITYAFYMDQLTDLYQINQFNADFNINNRFYLNNLVQQEPNKLLASDQQITDKFLSENAE